MKKTLLVLLTSFLFSGLSAQIDEIKTIKPTLVGKVQHFDCYKSSDLYTFTYRDYNFLYITVYKSFELSEEDYHHLYNVIINGFEDKQEKEITLETPNDVLRIKYSKSFGVINLQIYHSVRKRDAIGLSKYLTKKAVIKLFGFKKK